MNKGKNLSDSGNESISLETLRHSTAHVMAQAVKRLFPGVKVAIGPAINDGFYYDFDLEKPFVPEDLDRIEVEMRKIIDKDSAFIRDEISKEEAIDLFQDMKEPYKLELLEEIPDKEVSIYKNDDFTDLCRGPHLASTGKIQAFKLLSIAGAYWRGDEKNKMLSRIYGTAFLDEKSLAKYIDALEEAKKRDHRKLGKELDLFSIQQNAGPGLIFWHPRGARVRDIIETFWKKEHYRRGYELVYGPHISKIDLWKISGHIDFYKENMYSPMDVDEDQYIVKPMNCPGHILIFKSRLRSYRDLPIRMAELGTVYRYERSGVLHGMMRVRGFTQDDAHIFCTPDQMKEEIEGVIDLTRFMMTTFGFDYKVYLSTRPEKFVGTLDNWERSTNALRDALESCGLEYEVDPGEGVFYGPKIDIKLIDAIGRTWQGPTIQVDFNIPERFQVDYIGQDGESHRVVMIHRAVLGSLERFMGILIEHYAGAFPLWLAPEQVRILPINQELIGHAEELASKMMQQDIRAKVDGTNEKMGMKIRNAQVEKIPYMVVVGKREIEQGTISVRDRKKGELGSMSLEDFLNLCHDRINKRTID
ncbi:MAG: threonine--tRNA ligase [Candidatus Theseobacter exili]|nr:threonine--tRNA ligase [Candidatus Theseobacter exili]